MDQDHKALWNDIRKRREKWRTFIADNFRNSMNDDPMYVFIIIISK